MYMYIHLHLHIRIHVNRRVALHYASTRMESSAMFFLFSIFYFLFYYRRVALHYASAL